MKRNIVFIAILSVILIVFLNEPSFAREKHKNQPPGWGKGEKKGWQKSTSPGKSQKYEVKGNKQDSDLGKGREKLEDEKGKGKQELEKEEESGKEELGKKVEEGKSVLEEGEEKQTGKFRKETEEAELEGRQLKAKSDGGTQKARQGEGVKMRTGKSTGK